MKNDVFLSNILKAVKDYTVSNDERTFFDWLVYNQRVYGIDKPFTHSIAQIEREIHVKRKSQMSALNHFVKIGFLKVGNEKVKGNQYRSFFVDYSKLADENILGQIITENSETNKQLLKMFKSWAQDQANANKPMTKREQKRIEDMKTEAVELLNRLSRVYKERIEMFNNGELTGAIPKGKKNVTQLPETKKTVSALVYLLYKYDSITIEDSFLAYCDDVLRGNVKDIKSFLPYFLKCDDEEFPVFVKYLNKFQLEYTHS